MLCSEPACFFENLDRDSAAIKVCAGTIDLLIVTVNEMRALLHRKDVAGNAFKGVGNSLCTKW